MGNGFSKGIKPLKRGREVERFFFQPQERRAFLETET
jgi:hypothetical protein